MDIYSHLLFARGVSGSFQTTFNRRFDRAAEKYFPFFCAGSIAPDVGNFYRQSLPFAHLWHHLRCADFSRTLLACARTAEEYAFALGWLAHFLTDIESHPHFIETGTDEFLRSTGVDPSHVSDRKRLECHMRLEFGYSCLLLSQAENAWLWRVRDAVRLPQALFEADGFFCQAFARIYSLKMPARIVRRQWRQAFYFLELFPEIFAAIGAAKPVEGLTRKHFLPRVLTRLFHKPLLHLCRKWDFWFDAQVVFAPLMRDASQAQAFHHYSERLQAKVAEKLSEEGDGAENLSLNSGAFPWQGSREKILQITRYYNPAAALHFFKHYFPGEAEGLARELAEFYRRCLQEAPRPSCRPSAAATPSQGKPSTISGV